MPPRLARLLAVVGAIALIAVAFLVRGALAEDDADDATPSRGSRDPQEAEVSEFQLVCDEDLGDAVCAAAADLPGVTDVEVLSLAEVIAGLTGPPPLDGQGWDLWLTLDPMPTVLDTARTQAGLQPLTDADAVAPMASSPLAVLARASQVAPACEGDATWACLGEVERPGVAVPSLATSLGSVAVAAGAAAIAGSPDVGIREIITTDVGEALNDLLDDNSLGGAAARQARAMVQPGNAAAAVTTEALAVATQSTGQGASLTVLPLGPTVTVGVVLVGLGLQAENAFAAVGEAATEGGVRDALDEDGWAEAAPTSGLPSAGVVYALREELG